MLRTLEGPLGRSTDVSVVPFPSAGFDRAAREMKPELVVIDVTFLDETKVRPVMMRRFESYGSTLAFVAEGGYGWMDDLAGRVSGPIVDVSADALLQLISRPALTLVQA